MRKLLLAVFLFVALFSVICLAKPYTLVPWPYGVIAFVQTPSINQQQFIDDATQVVKDVFSFWNLPIPVPAEDWATPPQTDSQAYFAARYKMLLQSPSKVMASAKTPAPFVSPWQAEDGTAFPEKDEQHSMLVPCPVWSGWKIMPLTIGVFSSVESMNNLVGDYTFAGRFGSVTSYTMFRSQESWSRDEQEILHLFWGTSSIIISIVYSRHLLIPELSHWASWLWCQEHGVDLFSLPRLIIKGFADYTADSLEQDNRRRVIAAAWAQEGGALTDVPRPLIHEVGTSIISLLVQERGKKGLLDMLADPTVDWKAMISSLTPAWRESLAHVKISAGQVAMYKAALQDLALCWHMLAPVLPQEADNIVRRLYGEHGTTEDIDRFWNLVSQVPPEPSEDVWQQMIARVPTFLIVQSQDSDPNIRMLRARLQIKLDKYGEERNWARFYSTFIEALRKVVAHYGTARVVSYRSNWQ